MLKTLWIWLIIGLILIWPVSYTESTTKDQIPLIEIGITKDLHHHLSGTLEDNSCWDVWAVYKFQLNIFNPDNRFHLIQKINLSLYSVNYGGHPIITSQGWETLNTTISFPLLIDSMES